PGTAINVLLIRFADVLLMAAEAEAHVGTLEKAQEYVNLVRARAADKESWLYKYKNTSDPLEGFSDTPAANYTISTYPPGYFNGLGIDEALRAIYFERKLELAMEGHRFFDLSRWGIAEETLNSYFAYEGSILTDVKIRPTPWKDFLIPLQLITPFQLILQDTSTDWGLMKPLGRYTLKENLNWLWKDIVFSIFHVGALRKRH